MKKKSLFILLVLCIGMFIPKDTFALQVSNNVDIDYRFFVDEDESNAGNLKFKLYDKSGTLNFESQYDSNTKQYYFEYDENGFYKYVIENYYSDGTAFYGWDVLDGNQLEENFREYVPYVGELYQGDNGNVERNEFNSFLQGHQLVGTHDAHSNENNAWTFYTYIPMILENVDTGIKKICFASINVRHNWGGMEYVHLFFVNNTVIWKEEDTTLVDSFLDNVNFIRKTTLEYSDELWDELNNGPIASSEIYSDMVSSGKYVNKSLSNSNYNVPEETLDDYAASLPVFNFRKNNNDENKANIVDAITNPKTWNNGVTLLFISMIVVIGSSVFIIKKKV